MIKVALDFDNVLADTMSAWIKIYNKKYSKVIEKSDIIKWKFWSLLKIQREEAYEIFGLVWANWEELHPTEENIGLKIDKLNASCELDIVTSAQGDVKDWLKLNDVKYNNLIYTSEKAKLDYDIFIDDSPDEALKISKNERLCFLYDQPWNSNIRGRKIARVRNLVEATELVKTVE